MVALARYGGHLICMHDTRPSRHAADRVSTPIVRVNSLLENRKFFLEATSREFRVYTDSSSGIGR